MLVRSRAKIRVDLTGGPRLTGAGGSVVEAKDFPGRQGRLIFVYLATSDRPVPREELADALWPQGPPPNWKRDLSALASRLRALLATVGLDGARALSGAGGCYHLRLPIDAVVDVDLARRRAEEATHCLKNGDAEQALAAALAASAVARRPFLPGEESPWIAARRAELERALVAALDVAAEVLGARGELARALTCAEEAVELTPFRESGYVRLMRLHLAAGDRAEALRDYARCRELLATELGVDPAPETEAVYLEALRAGLDSSIGIGVSVGPESEGTSAGNLAAPATTFLGRDRDLERLAASLERARLVTLTGVGGVGKSRLALEAAARLAAAYPDGAWQSELTRVATGNSVPHAVAVTLGVQQRPEVTIEDGIVDFLRNKHLLLVVDNCEHVLDAIAGLLEMVLRACPRVVVLATSRERLGLDGEHLMIVEPLDLPAPGTDAFASMLRPASVQLFCDRAAAVRPGFALTPTNAGALADICRRLDGVPLALELAAARVRSLSVQEVAERLDQRFQLLTGGPRTAQGRQQTLRATVDWSYGLLSPTQQRMFDRLSVFAGSFAREAVDAVCDDGTLDEPTDNLITTLADKSMVVADVTEDKTRYRLLETLREYGRDRLVNNDATEVARRHAEYFVSLAEGAAERLRGSDEAVAMASLDRELDDLRAVHRWSIDNRRLDLSLRLSAALHWYALWRMRPEVSTWAEEATELPRASAHPLFPEVCATAGVGAWMRGDLRRAADLARRGVEAARGDAILRRAPLHILGDVGLFEGRLDDALGHYEAALAAAAEADDGYQVVLLLGCRALILAYRGDAAAGQEAAAESRRVAAGMANPTATAWSLYVSGEVLLHDDPQRAIRLLDASIDLVRSIGNTFALGVALVSASSVRGRHGDPRDALLMFPSVVEHWHRLGNWTQQWTTMRNVIELFVRVEMDQPAAVLLGAVEAAATAAPVFGPDAERLAATRQTLASRLGEGTTAAAAARGQTMASDAVVAFACRELRRALATLDG
jgi:predicted ATPase/DNA-binding SARP family transcriptional activator